MRKWIKSVLLGQPKTPLERRKRSFWELYRLQFNGQPDTVSAYDLLIQLDHSTSTETTNELVTEIGKIRYASNTNGVFYFIFPIVSHILYYKPESSTQLLHLVIGPNFADGVNEVAGMIKVITGAMNYKLNENPMYMTPEAQAWVRESLPNLHEEIDAEIQKCIKELNED